MSELIPANEHAALIERNKANGWEDLEPKRKAFGMRYVTDYNHRKAAEEAGFSPNSGLALTREPLLSAYIAELQESNFVTNIITEDFVRAQWLNMIPKLMGEEEVMLGVDNDGDQLSGMKFHPSEMGNVLKEMAKTTKIYEDGSGQSGNVNVQINVGDLIGHGEVEVKDV